MSSNVTDPPHYKAGEYECRPVQRALAKHQWAEHPDDIAGLSDIIKYAWRCHSKNSREENLRKIATEALMLLDEEWRMRVAPGTARVEEWPLPDGWYWEREYWSEPNGLWMADTTDLDQMACCVISEHDIRPYNQARYDEDPKIARVYDCVVARNKAEFGQG